ncbi:MAG TPA: hypothetical protein VIP57_13890 [Candidatus Dormibacteraeota bacterium]|jgi:hypothetical protein
MDSLRTFWGERLSQDARNWLVIAASVPLVVIGLPQLTSGFDYWPALALERGVRYGDSYLFAYPLPTYLPFAPLGLLPDPWPQWLAPVICLAFLAGGLWLWGGRRVPVLAAALLSPVGLGVLVNSNFNSAVAIFGLGLAVWAKRSGHPPLLGLGMALSLWRPVNCLPALVVLLASGWRWRELAGAAAGGLLFLAPITALAFLIEPGWVGTYRIVLTSLLGWSGLGPHLLSFAGPLVYAAAQVAVAVLGVVLLRRRSLAEATAVSLALTVFLATIGGAYSGSLALPALVLAADDVRYAGLPALAGLVGWVQAVVLLRIEFPVGVVAYWFALQAYPLLRRATIAPASMIPSEESNTPL